MINIEEIFSNRFEFQRYRENFFYDSPSIDFKTGLAKPILFIADKAGIQNASYFGVHQIEDIDYDIHVVSCESTVLFYLINIKAPNTYSCVPNGIILRRRPPHISDKEGVAVKHSFDGHFLVVTNRLATVNMFARDITAEPTT